MADIERTDFLATGPFTTARVLAALMANPSVAVATVRARRILQTNPSWQALFGSSSHATGAPTLASIFPGGRSAERFERALEGAMHLGSACLEHLLTRGDGSTFMGEIVVNLMVSDSDAGPDAVWQVRDITSERGLRRELREIEEYYRALSTYQWDLTFVLDRDLSLSYASPSVETVLGYRATEVLGESVLTYLHPDEELAGRAMLDRVVAGDAMAQADSLQVRVRHRDGSYRVLSCRQRNCLDIARIAGIVINARDITQEVLAQRLREDRLSCAARQREALFQLATSEDLDSSAQIDRILATAAAELKIHSASFWRFHPQHNRFDCERTHLRSDQGWVKDAKGEQILEAIFPLYYRELQTHRPIVVNDIWDHHAVSASHVQRLMEANVGAMMDFPVVRSGQMLGVMSLEYSGGRRVWEPDEISFAAGLSLLVALALESAERANAALQTEFMAMHDGLTGLANRSRAESALRGAIERAKCTGHRVALLLIDLDEFKEINDTFGHGRGDVLLAQVARLLLECAAGKGLVARMGGDEFLIILEDAQALPVEALAQTIVDRLSAEQLLADIDQTVGASIGIAVYPEDAADSEALLANADIAMYQAKEAGRNQYFLFNPRLAQRLKLQRELDSEIREALRYEQFSMFYQPQIDLETGALIGLEALLRWEHPERGLLLPNTFMAAARHNGLIDTITKWAITEVCEQNVAWQEAGLGSFPVSVNVTGRQFHDRHLPAIIAGALMRTGMAARHLILEVTEESLIENSKTTERVLAELKRLGIRIAIDDFGVGYSSLNYLRRLVVSQIKLDRAFIEGLPHDDESNAIVSAVITIARRLNYQVVAEGVETEEQADYLRHAGCEVGQGFYFGAPVSAAEMAQFLTENQHRNTEPGADLARRAAQN